MRAVQAAAGDGRQGSHRTAGSERPDASARSPQAERVDASPPGEQGAYDALEPLDEDDARADLNDLLVHFIEGRERQRPYADGFIASVFETQIVEIERDNPVGCSRGVLATLETLDSNGAHSTSQVTGTGAATARGSDTGGIPDPDPGPDSDPDPEAIATQRPAEAARAARRFVWLHVYQLALYLNLEYQRLLESVAGADPFSLLAQGRLYERIGRQVRYLQTRFVFPSVAREPIGRAVWARLEEALLSRVYRERLWSAVQGLEEGLFRTRVHLVMTRTIALVWLGVRFVLIPFLVVNALVVLGGTAVYLLVVVPLMVVAFGVWGLAVGKRRKVKREVAMALLLLALAVAAIISAITYVVLLLSNQNLIDGLDGPSRGPDEGGAHVTVTAAAE